MSTAATKVVSVSIIMFYGNKRFVFSGYCGGVQVASLSRAPEGESDPHTTFLWAAIFSVIDVYKRQRQDSSSEGNLSDNDNRLTVITVMEILVG